MLYDKELLRRPTTLCRILRDYLVLKGFQCKIDSESYRFIRGLAHSFFTIEEWKQYAVSCSRNFRQPNFSNKDASTNTDAQHINVIQGETDPFEEKKAAHNISQQFKKKKRFTGKLGENIHESLTSYKEASADYGLNKKLKQRYRYNLFKGETEQFHRSHVQRSCIRFQLASARLIEK